MDCHQLVLYKFGLLLKNCKIMKGVFSSSLLRKMPSKVWHRSSVLLAEGNNTLKIIKGWLFYTLVVKQFGFNLAQTKTKEG